MGSTRLANVVISIGADASKAIKGFRGLRVHVGQTGSHLKKLAKNVFTLRNAFIGLGSAAALGAVGKKLFDIGASAEETASKFRTVFGPATDQVQAFIDNFGVMAGLSQSAAQEIVATTGAIAQGLGFAQKASASFAEEVVRLAGDLASFNDLPTSETAHAIQSALTGERESLKRLGIVVMESDVQQRALLNTGKELVKELTQQEKATATLQLITKGAGKAVGDLGRTQDSAANRAKQLAARFDNIAQTVAKAVLPAIENLLPVLDQIAAKAEKAAEGVAGFVDAFSDLLGLSSTQLTATLNSIANLPDDMRVLRSRFAGVVGEVARLQSIVTQLEASPPLFDPHEGILPSEKIKKAKEELARAIAVMNELGRRMAALSSGGGEGGGGGALPGLAGFLERVAEGAIVARGSFLGFTQEATSNLKELADEGVRSLSLMENTAVGFANNAAASVAGFADSGIASFKRFRDFVIRSLIEIAAKFAIFSAISSFFPGFGNALGAAWGFKGRQHGGPVSAGRSYLGGAELFVPSAAGQIVPHHQLAGAAGGGDTVTHITLVGQDGSQLAETITVRQKRAENLDDTPRVFFPPVAMVGG